jgi:hypothetical protein
LYPVNLHCYAKEYLLKWGSNDRQELIEGLPPERPVAQADDDISGNSTGSS